VPQRRNFFFVLGQLKSRTVAINLISFAVVPSCQLQLNAICPEREKRHVFPAPQGHERGKSQRKSNLMARQQGNRCGEKNLKLYSTFCHPVHRL